MLIPEFRVPQFISDSDAETIHKRMMDNLPEDIDDTEGGHPFNFTKPTALEAAELLQEQLPNTIKIMFPMWAYGVWLDYHAAAHNMVRKAANPASGSVTVTGVPSTIIPAGFLFAAPAVGSQPAIEFMADEETTIGGGGTASIAVTAAVAGTTGNVAANAITIMSTPMAGIAALTNPDAITGGTAIESDTDLRYRIMEMIQNSEASFVGSMADYIRWAQAIPGVGKAMVIPEWDGAGTVKIILIDSNGEPANPTIIEAVYNDIVSPDDEMQRRAPIGATVTVDAPVVLTLDYMFLLTLEEGAASEEIVEEFRALLISYYADAKDEGEIKYQKVAAILMGIDGVADFSDLTINDGTANITIEDDEYPQTGTVDPAGGE